ncbi:MAG TPA: hypothetical protein EYM49_06565 [Campylobacterales bacterium]|nr:hypothetical protein [Campylobacterales bacterium]
MIKHLGLLLIIIMSLLLTFFCVEYHKETLFATLIPQNKKAEIEIEHKIIEQNPKLTNQDSDNLIESVERIEPVVTIRVDESEPNKPIIKKLSTKDLLGEDIAILKPIITSVITPQPTMISKPTPKLTPVPTIIPKATSNITKVQKDSKDEMSELEKLMIEEMKNF